jgi:hypothetical protein
MGDFSLVESSLLRSYPGPVGSYACIKYFHFLLFGLYQVD